MRATRETGKRGRQEQGRVVSCEAVGERGGEEKEIIETLRMRKEKGGIWLS